MRHPHHLLRHRSGVYHFRLVVPADIRPLIGLRIIKRSLHTRDPKIAQVAAWELSATYARAFAGMRRGSMVKPPSIKDIEAGFRDGTTRPYTRNSSTGELHADGPEDHARLMEVLQVEERLVQKRIEALAQEKETFDARANAAEKEALAKADREYQQLQAATPPAGELPIPDTGFSLNQMITLWLKVGVENITQDTVDTREAMLRHFAEHFGADRPIAAVRKLDVSAWTEYLATYGANGKPNGKVTRNNKCSHLKEFFNIAKDKGYYPKALDNPAVDVEKFGRGEKGKISERKGMAPFTEAQLKVIFSPESLRDRTEMPHTRRALVLGLFTGARVGELAQLLVSSFTVVGGHHCLSLDGEAKEQVSRRVIPVHPDLIRLGVLDWVKEQKKRGGEDARLFPLLYIEGKSKGNALSHGTTRLLDALNIKPNNRGGLDKRVGFHSFRSTVIQTLQGDVDGEGDIYAERRRVYVGHASDERHDRSSHKKNYMRAWKPEEIAFLSKRIRWGDWLDIDALRAVLAVHDPDPEAIKAKRNAARAGSRATKRKASAATG